jgi:raffinose/stachyose/melibiose transport system permease protein
MSAASRDSADRRATQGFTLLAVGTVIVATAVVVLYLFLQRHFIAGMLEGAVRE